MQDHQTDLAALLEELVRLPAHGRAAHLSRHGAVGGLVAQLADEAARLAISDLERALDATAMLLELAELDDDARARASAGRARAQALAWANRHGEALDAARAAIDAADRADLGVEAARARMSMMQVLDRMGRSAEAMEVGEAARLDFLAAGEPVLAARAEANLGIANRMRNRPDVALERFDRARAVLADDPLIAAQLDSNRAEALLELNEFAAAEAAFEAALEEFRAADVSRAEAIVEGNLADLMSRQGRLPLALRHFERARRSLEADATAPGDLARIEAEQAEAFAQAGLIDEAYEGFRTALPGLDQHGLVAEAARARVGLARALEQMDRFDDAEQTLQEAADAFQRLGHDTALGRTRLAQGELAARRGGVAKARAAYVAALALLEDRPADAALARHHLARAAIEDDALDEAQRYLAAGIDAAARCGLTPLLADLLHVRSALHARLGETEAEIRDLRAAIEHVERVRGSLQADRLRAAFHGARLTMYDDLVLALLDADDVDGAFEVSERARARALLDLVRGAVVEDVTGGGGERPGLLGDMRRLRAELNGLYSRAHEVSMATGAGGVERWRTRVAAVERQMRTVESRWTSTSSAADLFAPPISAAAARSTIGQGTTLVAYFVARRELIAFVLQADAAPVVRRLGDVDASIDLCEAFRFQVSMALGRAAAGLEIEAELVEDARRDLGELYAHLFEPLADAVGNPDTLVIIPHGRLHGVPFAALFDGEAHLLEHCAVTTAPSASVIPHLGGGRHGPSEGGGRTLVVGVADATAPNVAAEARVIGATIPDAELLLDADATRARVMAALEGAHVVHFACHARYAPAAPLASGLRLTDGWLTLQEVAALRLDDAVVVLSGCETGAGAVVWGDEVIGLVRAFIAGGARTLLSSLWMLHDAAARELMEATYRLWYTRGTRAGGLAAALRSAQLDLMRRRPHPAFGHR